MKISYMLRNESDEESEIPMGQAWKWILHIEDEIEIYLIFENLKKKLADNKLSTEEAKILQQEMKFLLKARFHHVFQIM